MSALLVFAAGACASSGLVADLKADWLNVELTNDFAPRVDWAKRAPGDFAAYELLLARPGTPFYTRAAAFPVLTRAAGDRSRFVPLAVRHLSYDRPAVRAGAAAFLGSAGSAADAAPLLALAAADPDASACIAAARALERIGDERAAVAVDVWVRFDKGAADKEARAVMERVRTGIRARLAAEKAKAAAKP